MAENAYYNKVIYGNETLVDLTGDTVAADKLLSGYTAHDASGALITGTASLGEDVDAEVAEYTTKLTSLSGAVDALESALTNVYAPIMPKAISANGTYAAADDDVVGYSEVTVNVPVPSNYIPKPNAITAGATIIYADNTLKNTSSTTYIEAYSWTCPKNGTYRLKTVGKGSRITSIKVEVNGSISGDEVVSTSGGVAELNRDITLSAGDIVKVWHHTSSASYDTTLSGFTVGINWDMEWY